MLISFLLIYGGLLVFGWFFSDLLIFQPRSSSYRAGGDFCRIPVTASETIGMLALPNLAAPYTILFSHGNAEDIGDLQEFFTCYRDQGFQVYAFDYRGYGISDGKPGSGKACADGAAALDYLVREKGIPLDRIILHGRSVGAAVAADLAARHKVAGLVMESPFVTAFRVRTVIPIAPFDKLRNNRRVREISCPLLVIHGEEDGIVPIWHGRKLYDLATVPKQAWWVPRAGHNDVCMTDPAGYWARLRDFSATLGERKP